MKLLLSLGILIFSMNYSLSCDEIEGIWMSSNSSKTLMIKTTNDCDLIIKTKNFETRSSESSLFYRLLKRLDWKVTHPSKGTRYFPEYCVETKFSEGLFEILDDHMCGDHYSVIHYTLELRGDSLLLNYHRPDDLRHKPSPEEVMKENEIIFNRK